MKQGATRKRGAADVPALGLRQRLVLGTALATSAFIGGYRGYMRRAYAACDPSAPLGTYTCSGVTTTTQTLTGAPLTVTTDPSFSIDTRLSTGGGGGNAFTLTGAGGISFTDNNNLSTITGEVGGIRADNSGIGALTITTTGMVTGATSGGIVAYNSAGTTDTTIEAADVSGQTNGIFVRHNGTGELSITSTGMVTGTAGFGIDVATGATSTDVTIETVDVSGNLDGIRAFHYGTGALSITATGTVTATNNNGIFAQAGGTTTDLTIEAADVRGGANGILALQYGTGALSITTTGTVTGTSTRGIFAFAYTGSTGLAIDAADVSGGQSGIYATHQGTGVLSITSTGTVTGTTRYGIVGLAGAGVTDLTIQAADVSGGNDGIFANDFGTGVLSITSTGTVTGQNARGIFARDYNGTGLMIQAVDVSGGTTGIYARHLGTGVLSITSTGTVAGSGSDGINAYTSGTTTDLTIEAADVSGGANGIKARHFGTGVLSITATGTVTGTNGDGISTYASGATSGLTVQAADVSGGNTGIYATHQGTGVLSITSTGTVTGTTRYGIVGLAGAGVTDLTIQAADVSGGNDGIFANDFGTGVLSITATGTVMGQNARGIFARDYNGTGLTIDAAAVSGGTYGIRALHNGSGALSITTTGIVTGTNNSGIFTRTGASTSGLIIEAVDISGGLLGIDAVHNGSGALSIAATGTVTGVSNNGIFASSTSATSTTLTIDVANVSAAFYGIYARHSGTGELKITSTGTVSGGIYAGIIANNNGAGLTIQTAKVYGGFEGIYAKHYGTGALSITATGTVRGANKGGILAQTDIAATGLTIQAADVSGRTYGIGADLQGGGALSITTTGTVTGTTYDGIRALTGINTTGLTIKAAAVSGGEYGIRANHNGGGVLSITATGAVTGTTEHGIYAYAGNSATAMTINTANVSGGTYGIEALHHGSGALSITSTGTASGAVIGIAALNDYGTGLTIEAMNVSGGVYGITVGNYTGDANITATGAVSGGNRGIDARQYASGGALTINVTGAVSGGDAGISALNDSAAAGSTTTVNVAGGASVTGGTAGIGLVSNTGRAASLTNAGSVSGAAGVIAQTSGPATITNSGTITGTGGTAINLLTAGGPNTVNQDGGTINGAILLSASPDVVNVTGGTINGDITGQGNADLNFAGNSTFGAGFTATGIDQVAMNSGTVDFNGTLSAARLTVNGGTMIMDGTSNLTGGTTVRGGILSVNGSLSGGLSVLGGRLQGIGTVFGNTENAAGGTIAPGNSIGTLTINGNYVGNSGTLEIEAALGGDASPADRLVVTGDTSGSTNVRFINVGGTGAQTVEGIKVVDVGGASNGTFTLLGDFVFQGQQAVVAGAYGYVLQQNGISTPTDGDWYLRSALFNPEPIYAPGVPLYEAYAGVLQSFNQLGTLQQRLGNRSWTVEAQGADALSEDTATQPGLGIWARIEGAHGSFDPATTTTGASYDVSTWKLETGLDAPLYQREAGMLVGGVAFHYGRISSDISSVFGDGSIDANGYGVSGSLTWHGNTGFYVGGQAHVTWFDSDLYSDTLGMPLASGNDALGYALSLEAGQRIPVSQRWSVTPQAQLAYSAVDFDDFTDPFGATVSLDDGDSLVGRLGLSADYEDQWTDTAGRTSRAHLYGIANLYYDFLGHYDVDVSGVRIVSETQALWGGLGIGGSLDWADGKYSLFGEVLGRTSLEDFGDSHALSGTVGFRVSW